MQAWNDEQIAVFDCQERLKYYDYVAVIDTDEFVIPTATKSLKNALKIYLVSKIAGKMANGLRGLNLNGLQVITGSRKLWFNRVVGPFHLYLKFARGVSFNTVGGYYISRT